MDSCKITDNKKKLADSNNQFALDLYKLQAENEDANVFLSPFSIELALAMTLAGARNTTAEEMRETLKLQAFASDSEIHAAFNDLISNLSNLNQEGINFHLANRIFVQQKFSILAEFQRLLEEMYQSSVVSVDFEEKSEEIRQEINDWVEKQTHEKITNLIKDGGLDSLARLVLINAVYFKGNWDKKFSTDSTNQSEFHVDESTIVPVEMMFQKARFPFAWSSELDCLILELPYVGRKLSMLLVLPNEVNGLKALEEKLNAESLQLLIDSMCDDDVLVSVPKFRIKGEKPLSKILSRMGMITPFNEKKADFSGIDGTKDLYISEVFHKAFLEVNEEGCEAAAATAVLVKRCKTYTMPSEFVANHPFLIMIRDNSSGIILFIGRLVNPSA